MNAGLLAFILYRRGHFAMDDRLKRRLPRIVLASAGMAGALVLAHWALAPWFAANLVFRAGALTALVFAGLASFVILAHFFGAAGLRDLRGLLRREDAA
jgi:putative peptidoglycan lipid II flippase